MNESSIVKLIGILASSIVLLISLLIMAQEGLPSLRFLLFFVLAPVIVFSALLLPARLAQLQLALLWPAGLLLVMSSALSFIGIGFLFLPLAAVILVTALYQTVNLPKPKTDWLLILPATIFSWIMLLAYVNFGTVKATNRFMLILGLIFVLLVAIKNRSIQNWVMAVVLISLLTPLAIETVESYFTIATPGGYQYLEPIARQIIYNHPKSTDKQLTRLFISEVKKRLQGSEKFAALIKRESKNAYSVSWQIERVEGQSAFGGGFFVGQPRRQKSPIRVTLPPEGP